MYCNQCGNELLDMAQFCSNCGSSQTSEVTDIQVQTSEQIHDEVTNIQFKKPLSVSNGEQKKAGEKRIRTGIVLAVVFTFPYWGILSLFDTTPGVWGILFWYWYPAVLIIQGIRYQKMSDQEWNKKVAQNEANARGAKSFLTNFAVGFLRGYFLNKR